MNRHNSCEEFYVEKYCDEGVKATPQPNFARPVELLYEHAKQLREKAHRIEQLADQLRHKGFSQEAEIALAEMISSSVFYRCHP